MQNKWANITILILAIIALSIVYRVYRTTGQLFNVPTIQIVDDSATNPGGAGGAGTGTGSLAAYDKDLAGNPLSADPATRDRQIMMRNYASGDYGAFCFKYTQAATISAPYAVTERMVIEANSTMLPGEVNGQKSGTQAGPDMTNGYRGTIKGSRPTDTAGIVGQKIIVDFAYEIEGSRNIEREIYEIGTTGLTKLRYPLQDAGNGLIPITAGNTPTRMSYPAVECDTTFWNN